MWFFRITIWHILAVAAILLLLIIFGGCGGSSGSKAPFITHAEACAPLNCDPVTEFCDVLRHEDTGQPVLVECKLKPAKG